MKQGAFVVEELITQGDEIAVVHPQSVNSFRVVTFTIDNKVYILGLLGELVQENLLWIMLVLEVYMQVLITN